MPQSLAHIALLVRDYDEALAYYITILSFTVIEDTKLTPEKRWVRIAPNGSTTPCLLLAKAATPEQASRIGNQSGGRVFLFLNTDDFHRDYQAYKARGVKFIRPISEEPYGTVAVFEDLYGNKWDLIQPRMTPLSQRD